MSENGPQATQGQEDVANVRNWGRPWLAWAFWAAWILWGLVMLVFHAPAILTWSAWGLVAAIAATNSITKFRDKRRREPSRSARPLGEDSPPKTEERERASQAARYRMRKRPG